MFSIAIFGDSITFGTGDSPHRQGWAGRLKKYFESKNKLNVLYNLGVPGNTTTREIAKRIDIECFFRKPKRHNDDRFAVIVAIGINDVKAIGNKNNFQVKEKEFGANIKRIIRKLKKYTNEIYFLGLIPVDESINPLGNNYFINKNINQYNQILINECYNEGVVFIDLFSKIYPKKNNAIFSDGLHPNSKGYEYIYKIVKKELVVNKLLP